MKITLTIVLLCSALLTMSFLINNDDPKFKNLKVLPKDISKDQMDSVMHHFANALGKKCNFCHEFNQELKKMDFASDAKEEKKVAREMWKMTAQLNKKYFDIKDSKNLDSKLKVTCFSCHRGAEHPVTAPPMREEAPRGRPGEPRPSLDSSKH